MRVDVDAGVPVARRRSVTSQRSTTVRPSQYSDAVSIAMLHFSVVTSVGSITCATASVVDRRAVEAVALAVELEEEVGELGDRTPDGAGASRPLRVPRVEEGLVRDVEPDHRHRDPAAEDDRRGFGIDERVELGRRRDVPLRDRAAHPDDPLETTGHLGVSLDQLCHNRWEPGRGELSPRLEQAGEELDGIDVDRRGRGPARREVTRSRRGRSRRSAARARAGDRRRRRPGCRCGQRARAP